MVGKTRDFNATDETSTEGGARGLTTRRAVIAGVAAGLTGLVADSLITAEPAGAAGQAVMLGASNTSSVVTEISNTSNPTSTAALLCDDGGAGVGPAIVAQLTNASNPAAAIQASAAGGGPAIDASTATAGPAVHASTTGAGYAVQALTEGGSKAAPLTPLFVGDNYVGYGGAQVHLDNTLNDSTALEVITAGGGYAIYVECTNTTNAKAVIAAVHHGLGSSITVTNLSLVNLVPTVDVSNIGRGPAIQASDLTGGQGAGVTSLITEPSNYTPGFTATTQGRGPAIRATVDNTASGGPAVEAAVSGSGPVISATTTGSGAGVAGVITNTKSQSSAVSGITSGPGAGVSGAAQLPAATGVHGSGSHGATGVNGSSDTGTGVHAASGSGVALAVDGRLSLSRSGIAAVPARGRSITVPLSGVSPRSMVFATIQQLSGSVAVSNVVPADNSFTINLSQAAPSALRVAWMVLD